MNTSTKLLLILFVAGLCFACSSDPDPAPAHNVTVKVSDSNGQALLLYALQVIDPNDGWLGTPFKSVTGGEDHPAALYIPGGQAGNPENCCSRLSPEVYYSDAGFWQHRH